MKLRGTGKRVFGLLFARFPAALPVGMKELETFSHSILELYHFPDLPSYHHSIASMIMHLGPLTTHKSKHWFARCIKKAMANQIAYQKIQDLKKAEEDTTAQMERVDVEKAPSVPSTTH